MAHRTLTRNDAGTRTVSAFEKMYTPAELAERWKLSEQSIRRLFQDVPGVLKIGDASPRGKRSYTTLRIPGTVVERVFRERSR